MDFDDLLGNTVELFQTAPRRARALPAALPARARRRVPGHQPRPERAGRCCSPASTATSASSATATSRSTSSAAPTSATSSSSRTRSPTPPSSCSSRTTGRPRPSSTPPTRSSPTTSGASPRSCGPSRAQARRSCATTPTTRPTRPSGSPTRSRPARRRRLPLGRHGRLLPHQRPEPGRGGAAHAGRASRTRSIGGTRFYDRREVKDALAYLKAVVNPADEVSVKRVLNMPKRGIGDSTVGRLDA